MSGMWSQATADVRRRLGPQKQMIRIGALNLVFSLEFFMSGLIILSQMLYLAALGNAVFNVANAYETWGWWRLWGPLFFTLPTTAFINYVLFQMRKGAAVDDMTNFSPIHLGRTFTEIWFWIFLAYMGLMGVFVLLCMLWMSIDDVANCTSSALCQGVNLSSTASRAIIMLQVGGYFMVLVFFFVALMMAYINSAAKSVYMRNNAIPDPYEVQENLGQMLAQINAHIEQMETQNGGSPPDTTPLYYPSPLQQAPIGGRFYGQAGQEMLVINV